MKKLLLLLAVISNVYASDIPVKLILDAERLTQMHSIGPVPEVVYLDDVEIKKIYCTGRVYCNPLAMYDAEDGANKIYVNKSALMLSDTFYESVLLHELIHWIQVTNKYGIDMNMCRYHYNLEKQAYELQEVWMHEHGYPKFKNSKAINLCNKYTNN